MKIIKIKCVHEKSGMNILTRLPTLVFFASVLISLCGNVAIASEPYILYNHGRISDGVSYVYYDEITGSYQFLGVKFDNAKAHLNMIVGMKITYESNEKFSATVHIEEDETHSFVNYESEFFPSTYCEHYNWFKADSYIVTSGKFWINVFPQKGEQDELKVMYEKGSGHSYFRTEKTNGLWEKSFNEYFIDALVEHATLLEIDKQITAQFYDDGNNINIDFIDIYAVKLTAKTQYIFSLIEPPDANFQLQLHKKSSKIDETTLLGKTFVEGDSKELIFTSNTTDTYYIIVKAVSGTGEYSLKLSKKNSAPIANAGEDINAMRKEKIQFDCSASYDPDGDELYYTWDFDSNDGISSDSNKAKPTHTYEKEGIYHVTLKVKDKEGAESMDVLVVTVKNKPPIAKIRIVNENKTIFVGMPVTFDASDSSDDEGDVLSYYWDWGDNTSETKSKIVSHTYKKPGRYTVILMVEDGHGGNSTTTLPLDVKAKTSCTSCKQALGDVTIWLLGSIGGIVVIILLSIIYLRKKSQPTYYYYPYAFSQNQQNLQGYNGYNQQNHCLQCPYYSLQNSKAFNTQYRW
ncbi:MAG: PKD domain-containing protein [Candidatus Thermoplasmatota archaeon]